MEQPKTPVAQKEEEILAFWQKNNIFKKSLEKPSPKGNFVFYDGPPFATGLPHYGHMLPGTIKDVIPRFKTMQGYHVPRRWGWDTHGLPVENLIEKELGLKNKKDIEDLGIEKFNEAARASVLRYDADWKRIIPRSGRWVDMDNAYLTMDPTYTESIWWSFKSLYQKDLIYQAFKVMYLCPHCQTTLSNFEVTQGYKDITDISVYVKFELVDEPGTFVLAWTTTPWTLPGNVALAVNPEVTYIKVDNHIIAKDLFEKHKEKFANQDIQAEFSGKELIGKSYKPVFDYYSKPETELKNKENAWKIYGADFVTITDGTGVVHIAPAYGEDDYKLSEKYKLPVIHHVGTDGTFKKEVTDLVGHTAKPKEDHQKGDVEIIKLLAGKKLLFAKEKIIHSYPHCWRCDTPLLNYATTSWFVKVTDIKDKIVAENQKVSWVPKEIGEGRFGKWLENARDWAISRSRYWGATLPVWICKECNKIEVMGSLDDLKTKTKRNTYIVLRHGESENNVQNILSNDLSEKYHLTEKGRKDVEKQVAALKEKGIDLIVSSDITRTKETAEIVQKGLGLDVSMLTFDKRLREYDFGAFNGKSIDEWHSYWDAHPWGQVEEKVQDGESPRDMMNRIGDFIEELDAAHQGKTILIVSHEDPIRYLTSYARGDSLSGVSREQWKTYRIKNADTRDLPFAKIPRNNKKELDFHRPYSDEVSFDCSCGGTMKRVPEVFDTWYESGSMPFAQLHYPFENKEKIDSGTFFPADFIAEGQDQTRGWFYSLLVLSTALFGTSPYKSVIVNGIILAEDGQKMSKRLKNYPEINIVFDKYGADAMRYFLLASPAVRADDLAFSEKGLDDVVKKIISKLENVYSFYETYIDKNTSEKLVERPDSKNILDLWILSRLDQIGTEITTSLEKHELDRAARPFMNFVDDLSTWYLRRSRDRFKGDDVKDKTHALQTTRYVLLETAKLMAPFMPFLAEGIYQKVKGTDAPESVHLENWPTSDLVNDKLLNDMNAVRNIVSVVLDARAKVNIKVRQPLSKLTVKNMEVVYGKELSNIIRDEVNVKSIIVGETGDSDYVLDTNITPELQEEGNAREFIRALQDLRKKSGLSPHDVISLIIETDEAGKNLVQKFEQDIKKTAQVKAISFDKADGEELKIEHRIFKMSIVR